MGGQQPVTFIGPRQSNLVEMLPNLPSKGPQRVKFFRTAEKLFVVASRALVRAVLIGNVAADFPVVFYRSPDTDMDCGQHGSFGDHCRTSACSTPKRMNSGVWVMPRFNAAASRIASTRISVGMRSRYRMPFAMEWSLRTLPNAVAIAI